MLSGLPMSSQPYLSSTPRSTRSSSVVTLSCHPTTSALKITDRSFRYASPRLWNQLPDSFCQRHQSCLDSSCSSSTCQPIFVIIPAHHSRPTMFNTLPDDLRYPAVSTSTFRQSLKTHLFSAYQHVQRIRGVSRNALYRCTILTFYFYLLIIHKSFILSLQAQNLLSQQILPTLDLFCLLDCLHDNGTRPDLSRSSVNFLVFHYNLCLFRVVG